jgi:hypothetical protein
MAATSDFNVYSHRWSGHDGGSGREFASQVVSRRGACPGHPPPVSSTSGRQDRQSAHCPARGVDAPISQPTALSAHPPAVDLPESDTSLGHRVRTRARAPLRPDCPCARDRRSMARSPAGPAARHRTSRSWVTHARRRHCSNIAWTPASSIVSAAVASARLYSRSNSSRSSGIVSESRITRSEVQGYGRQKGTHRGLPGRGVRSGLRAQNSGRGHGRRCTGGQDHRRAGPGGSDRKDRRREGLGYPSGDRGPSVNRGARSGRPVTQAPAEEHVNARPALLEGRPDSCHAEHS